MNSSRQRRLKTSGSTLAVSTAAWVALATVWIAMGPASEQALAGNGGTSTLPVMRLGRKITSDWLVTVDTRWVNGNGYRPIRLEIEPIAPGPTTADREIVVKLCPNSYSKHYTPMEVVKTIEIPQGSTKVTASVSVPQSQLWYQFRIEVHEDGNEIEDLSEQINVVQNAVTPWSESAPSMLFIDSRAPTLNQRQNQINALRRTGRKNETPKTLPDVRAIASFIPDNNVDRLTYDTSKQADDIDILLAVTSMPRVELLPPADLPEKWIDYSAFDLIVVSLRDLKQLARSDKQRWAALRSWAAAGHTLCVYDIGEDFERLAELEKLLELPDAAKYDAAGDYPGWRKPDPRLFGQSFHPSTMNNAYGLTALAAPIVYGDDESAQAVRRANRPPKKTKEKPPAKPPFLSRELNLGQVIALAPEDPCTIDVMQLHWLMNSLRQRDIKWVQRHGLSMSRENRDYWNFLIPGVGKAPVTSFLVLISVFVIFIGPTNYLVLRRNRRLYLLLVTVPLGAALVTGGLFSYALLTDGLMARVRVRSYTQIDQRSGRAVSWSRQSYYAGLTPSGGLNFPLDTAVFQLEHFPKNGYGMGGRKRVDMSDGQTLKSGYLASRSSSQFVAVRSAATKLALKVLEFPKGSEPPEAANHLETTIRKLYLCDARGDFYTAEQIAPGQTFRPQPISMEAAQDEFADILAGHRPSNPEGYDPVRHSEGWIFGNNTRYWNQIDAGQAPPTQSSSVLETNLQALKRSMKTQLPPGSYAAVVDDCAVVPIGISDAQQEASIHVIVGRW